MPSSSASPERRERPSVTQAAAHSPSAVECVGVPSNRSTGPKTLRMHTYLHAPETRAMKRTPLVLRPAIQDMPNSGASTSTQIARRRACMRDRCGVGREAVLVLVRSSSHSTALQHCLRRGTLRTWAPREHAFLTICEHGRVFHKCRRKQLMASSSSRHEARNAFLEGAHGRTS